MMAQVFAGTTVSSGQGTFIVTATGMNTEIGMIQAAVQESKEDEGKTPLGKRYKNARMRTHPKLLYTIDSSCVDEDGVETADTFMSR